MMSLRDRTFFKWRKITAPTAHPNVPPVIQFFPLKPTELKLLYESNGDASYGMQRVWVQKLKEWSLIKLEAAIALCFNTS